MKIGIDSNLIEVVSGLQNNNPILEQLENKEEILKNYQSAGVILDAVDDINSKATKEMHKCQI